MADTPIGPDYAATIRASSLTVYDEIPVGHPALWIPTAELERMLQQGLEGMSLVGLANRTRSKVVKSQICVVLGYPVTASFKKCQPRFSGQQFDTYVQKSDNLQVWNESVSPTRRYVLIRVSDNFCISRVKVIAGDALASLDKTGTLTQKYQARCIIGTSAVELVVPEDTDNLRPFVGCTQDQDVAQSPVAPPAAGQLFSIGVLLDRLSGLIGQRFADPGVDQERNRGTALHRLVCRELGYTDYSDDGRFPDVRHQLVEVKLQTSPTIDLGLVRPISLEPLDVPMIMGRQIRHCDVRYAIFYGQIENQQIRLTNLILSTGEAFFSRFPQFQGKVLNTKLQIPLPADFFAS